ncbi:MAG: NUDIX domain-containing protein [Bacteroidales bacterium]|nr:NUDIX domain-containing protein [Bacteroidales bacterium]
MYKVFHNSGKILLLDSNDFVNNSIEKTTLISTESMKQLLAKDALVGDYFIRISDKKTADELLEDLFKIHVAAGGWVFDTSNRLLMIHRRGSWDIPKGHLDANETLEECAIREVQEETGLDKVQIDRYLGISYHIYKLKGEWILKLTHWYKMKSDSIANLVPEEKEGITTVKWIEEKQIEENLTNGWPALLEFYQRCLKPKKNPA